MESLPADGGNQFFLAMIQGQLNKNALIASFLTLAYQVGLAPIMSFGVTYILLRLIHGGEANMSMLLDFLKPPQVLKKVYAASLIVSISYLFNLITNMLGMPDVETQEQFFIRLAVVSITILLIFWIMLRLFLFPYLFITKPNEKISVLVKLSFQSMKGQVRHLIWYGITVYIWHKLLLVGFLALFSKLISYDIGKAGGQHPLVMLFFYMIFGLLNPYIYTAFAAYANELLPEEGKKNPGKKGISSIG